MIFIMVSMLLSSVVSAQVNLLEVRANLNFGDLFASEYFGRVQINQDGIRYHQGGAYTKDENFSSLVIEVKGVPGTEYDLILPEDINLVSASGDTIVVKLLKDQFKERTIRRRINVNGIDLIKVGGIVSLPPLTSPGHYTGNASIQVLY